MLSFLNHNFDKSPAASMLNNKLKKAIPEVVKTRKEYEEYHSNVGQDKSNRYLDMEKKAQRERGDALKVYQVSSNGESALSVHYPITIFNPFSSPYSFGNAYTNVTTGQTQWCSFRTDRMDFERHSDSGVTVSRALNCL